MKKPPTTADLIAKRQLINFHLGQGLLASILLIFGLLLLGYVLVHGDFNIGILIAFVLVAAGLYTVWMLWKNVAIIKVNESGISFRGKTYPWKEVGEVKLNTKVKLPYRFGRVLEGAHLKFEDGKELYLFDDLHTNVPALKRHLHEKLIRKKRRSRISKQRLKEATYQTQVYKTSIWFSIYGLGFWFLVLVFLSGLLNEILSADIVNAFAMLLALALIYGLGTHMFHYFIIEEDQFIIRNPLKIGWSKAYPLESISELVFEYHGEQSERLRVINWDFNSRFFVAASLRSSKWLQMRKDLVAWGILVRNEAFVE